MHVLVRVHVCVCVCVCVTFKFVTEYTYILLGLNGKCSAKPLLAVFYTVPHWNAPELSGQHDSHMGELLVVPPTIKSTTNK